MISTFLPVSDSFVVAGTADSHIQVLLFPDPALQLKVRDSHVTRRTQEAAIFSHAVTRPTSTTVLGKCSHWAVNDIALLEEYVAAASGSTISIWDLVKTCRVRHLTTPDLANTCKYVGTQLLAAAGHGRLVHFYDMRMLVHSLSPAWTTKLATDNLYALAVDECTVFAAGADGCIYGVDLRAHQQYRWDLQPCAQIRWPAQSGNINSLQLQLLEEGHTSNAILDLKVLDDILYVTLESGQVCGVPRQFPLQTGVSDSDESDNRSKQLDVSGGDFVFAADYLSTPVKTKIGCDVLSDEDGVHLAVGSELGKVNYFRYDQRSGALSARKTVDISDYTDMSARVRWAPKGLFASAGSTLCLLPFR